jgi:hypothetical protein
MKTLIKFSFVAATLLTAAKSHAQSTGDKIKHDATVAGHKTSEVAANGAAAVVDKRYEGKYGPGGQTIYINKYSHYYYISHLGHKVYLKRSALRDHK